MVLHMVFACMAANRGTACCLDAMWVPRSPACQRAQPAYVHNVCVAMFVLMGCSGRSSCCCCCCWQALVCSRVRVFMGLRAWVSTSVFCLVVPSTHHIVVGVVLGSLLLAPLFGVHFPTKGSGPASSVVVGCLPRSFQDQTPGRTCVIMVGHIHTPDRGVVVCSLRLRLHQI